MIIPDTLSEQLREQLLTLGQDPANLDRCLACEQHAKIRAAGAAGRTVSLDDFEILLGLAGRNAGPWLLHHARCRRVISNATISAVTADVWSAAEYPQDSLLQVDWLDLFNTAGFTIDGRPADRPERPTLLWRGSVPRLRRRMSWTSDRELAENFALAGFRGRPQGTVYQTEAPPKALLCINHTSRQESEHVLNTRGLVIRRADGSRMALPSPEPIAKLPSRRIC
jgi:hypothetical protein